MNKDSFNSWYTREAALRLATFFVSLNEGANQLLDVAEKFREFLMPRKGEAVKGREDALRHAIQRDATSSDVIEVATKYYKFLSNA